MSSPMYNSVGIQLINFMANPGAMRNAWLKDDHLEIYVRHSTRMLPVDGDWKRCDTLDIANIRDVPELYRGKGHWKTFITTAEGYNRWDAVYVENIHPAELRDQLSRHGYQMVHPGDVQELGYASMFKMNHQDNEDLYKQLEELRKG
jgi:hypothetical protein